MTQLCFICSESLDENEIVTVNRGMKTLIDSSVERSDGFFEYLKDKKSVTVHKECRRIYTRKSTVLAAKRKYEMEQANISTISSSDTQASVNKSDFCFEKLCLFCGKEANEQAEAKKTKSHRRYICRVVTHTFKDTILNIARTYSNDTTKNVIARIEYESNLFAAGAKYHKNCYYSFLRPPTGRKRGRPLDDYITSTMEEIFAYIENSDDCQFSFDELKNVCEIQSIDHRTIKRKLKLKYGENIIMTEKQGKPTLFCIINKPQNFLNDAWYGNKKQNEEEERFRILETAATIIREDIQSRIIENKKYPPPSQLFEDIDVDIPESLIYFLEEVILKNKRYKLEYLKLVCTTISHCIMAAVRPRSFKSRLQLGLSIFFHRKFGSKRLIEICSLLGLCASYNDTMIYEAAKISLSLCNTSPIETSTVNQCDADNSDINFQDQFCSNIESNTTDEDSYDIYEEMTNESVFEQIAATQQQEEQSEKDITK